MKSDTAIKGPRIKMYNAGLRIQEVLNYSDPAGHDIHCLMRWQLDAPEKEFFYVPTQCPMSAGGVVPVDFAGLILRGDRFGSCGVVKVDPEWEPPEDQEAADNEPIAQTDAEAIAKANCMLRAWEERTIQDYIDQANAIMAVGGKPVPAQGRTKYLLSKYKVQDPTQSRLLKPDEQAAQMNEMNRIIAAQNEKIEALLAANSKKAAQPRA